MTSWIKPVIDVIPKDVGSEEKFEPIPTITDEQLIELNKRIKPLVIDEKGHLWYIDDPSSLRSVSFIWCGDAHKTKRATDLVAVAVINTYHTYTYYGFFKPSVAEVLAQIPTELMHKVSAYRCIGPDTASDLNKHQKAFNASYHVARTTLYAKREHMYDKSEQTSP